MSTQVYLFNLLKWAIDETCDSITNGIESYAAERAATDLKHQYITYRFAGSDRERCMLKRKLFFANWTLRDSTKVEEFQFSIS